MIFPVHLGVELNRQPGGGHGAPHSPSMGRVRAYFSRHFVLFIISTLVGAITFLAIASDSQYTSLGIALGNGLGAFLFFGSTVFFIGLTGQLVRNLIKRWISSVGKQNIMKANSLRHSRESLSTDSSMDSWKSAGYPLPGISRPEDQSYPHHYSSSGPPVVDSAPLVDRDLRDMLRPGRVFISYRREDASHIAGRLSDRLIDQLGDGQVFIDVDSIELGVDYRDIISNAVGQCDILLAIIGNRWFEANEYGEPRLFMADDLVRLEIEAALGRGIKR